MKLARASLAAAALCVVTGAALTPGAAAAPLVAQGWVDRTPAGMPTGALCPVDLGPADAVAWLGSGAASRTPQLQAAGVAGAAGGGPAAGGTRTGPSGGPTAGGTGASPTSGAPLERVAGAAGCPVVAATGDGAALLAYTDDVDTGDPRQVMVAERPPGGPLGAPLPLGGPAGGQVAAARAPGGAAVVAWLERERVRTDDLWGTALRFRPVVAVRGPGESFAAPVALGEPAQARSSDRATPAVGIDAAGNAIVVWARPPAAPSDDAPLDELWVARRPAGGAFGPPERLYAATRDVPRLVVAPTGEALLLTDAPDGGMLLATGSARDGFGPPAPALPGDPGTGAPAPAPSAGPAAPALLGDSSAGEPVLAIAPGGGAVVAWLAGISGEPGTAGVTAIARPSGAGAFSAPHQLVARLQGVRSWKVEDVRLALAPDGRALVTWMGAASIPGGGRQWVPFAAHGSTGGTWEAPVRVTSGCRWAYGAQPAFGGDGSPRVSMLSSSVADGGDIFFPARPRLRTVSFGASPPADRRAPKLTLTAPRRQTLPRWRYQRERGVRARVRCSEECDVAVTPEVLRGKDREADGFFPAYPRLRAGVARPLTLHTTDALHWGYRGAELQAGDRIAVRLTASACDAAGNVSRATVRIRVTLPRDVYRRR